MPNIIVKPTAPRHQPGHPLARGLLLDLALGERGGTRLRDAGPSGRDYTLQFAPGSSTYVSTPWGPGLRLASASSQYARGPDVGLPIDNAPRTIVVAFRATTIPGGHVPFVRWGQNATNKLCSFGHRNVLDFTNYGASTLGSTALVAGRWYVGAYSFDGTTGRLYLDGKLDATDSTLTIATALDGASDVGALPGLSLYYNGDLAAVKVYNRGLPAPQVAALTGDLFAELRPMGRGLAGWAAVSNPVVAPSTPSRLVRWYSGLSRRARLR